MELSPKHSDHYVVSVKEKILATHLKDYFLAVADAVTKADVGDRLLEWANVDHHGGYSLQGIPEVIPFMQKIGQWTDRDQRLMEILQQVDSAWCAEHGIDPENWSPSILKGDGDRIEKTLQIRLEKLN